MYQQTNRWLRGRLSSVLYILTAVLAVSVPMVVHDDRSDLIDALAGPAQTLAETTTTTARSTSPESSKSSSTAASTAVTAVEIVEVTAPPLSNDENNGDTSAPPAIQPVATQPPTTRAQEPSTTAAPTTSGPTTTQPPTTKPPTTTTAPTTTTTAPTTTTTTAPTTTTTTTEPPTTQPPTTVAEECVSGPWKTLARARREFSKNCEGFTRVDCAELIAKKWTCSSEELERPSTTQTTTTQATTAQPTTTVPTTTTTTSTTGPPQPAVMGLVVLNAASGEPFDGGTITFFTVEAFAPSGTRSVRFSMSGPVNSSKLEKSARWTLFGNNGNQLGGRAAVPGTYTVTATAYSGNSGGGTVLATGSIGFTFG